MFGIDWSEFLLIAIVALIFIGPKELPQVMYKLAQAIGKLRNQADDFRRQFEESAREAGLQDLQKNLQDFRQLNPANQLKDSIDRALSVDQTNTIAPPPAELPTDTPAAISSEAAPQSDALKSETASAGDTQPAGIFRTDADALQKQFAQSPDADSDEARRAAKEEEQRLADAAYWEPSPEDVKYPVAIDERDEKVKPTSALNGSGSSRPQPVI